MSIGEFFAWLHGIFTQRMPIVPPMPEVHDRTPDQLTAHFYLHEFLRSRTAVKHGLATPDVPPHVLANLTLVCTLLEDIRTTVQAVGVRYTSLHEIPINITSGWRWPALNVAVDGEVGSYHTEGLAVDFHAPGIPMHVLADIAVNAQVDGLKFDKVILEYGQWVHAQLAKPGRSPRQMKIAAHSVSGKATYHVGSFDPPGGVWVS